VNDFTSLVGDGLLSTIHIRHLQSLEKTLDILFELFGIDIWLEGDLRLSTAA
jgi:hypothetical protein